MGEKPAHHLLKSLHVSGQHLLDEEGRVVTLRGFSVAGSCKLPIGLPTHSPDLNAFFDHKNVSFVGRPFPLDEADDHLARLSDWGATFLRLLVPWEALEHDGPGLYDDSYITYLDRLIAKFSQYGIKCIIDSHQDVWSRLCGGSGAPGAPDANVKLRQSLSDRLQGWTLDLAGFDIGKLHSCCAAFLHSHHLEADAFKHGAWPTNYQKLASATMFTLFWIGDTHAPQLRIRVDDHAAGAALWPQQSDVGIGTFLQTSHGAAYAHLAKTLAHHDALIGFEPMNEPHRGYVSLHSFDSFDPLRDLHFGLIPTALQSFALGDGHSVAVPFYVRSFPEPTRIAEFRSIAPSASCWVDGCLWRKHRIWEWNDRAKTPVSLRRQYFSVEPHTGRPIDFDVDCWRPFVQRFGERMQAIRTDWLIFAGGVPGESPPLWPKHLQPPNLVYAPHFYDLHVLFMKYLGNVSINVQALSSGAFVYKALHLGRKGRKINYLRQTGNIIGSSLAATDAPCFIGEFGLPYDINKFHQTGSGDFRWHEQGLDVCLSAFEQISPSTGFALWCYDPINTAQYGDGWMGEDFSCISQDAHEARFQFEGGGGARSLDALQRPYATRTAGIPLTQSFDMHSLAFVYTYRNVALRDLIKPPETRVTAIYLPRRRYGRRELDVRISDGSWKYTAETQTLLWTVENLEPGHEHSLTLSVRGRVDRVPPPDIDLSQISTMSLGLAALALFVVLVSWFVR